LDQVRQYSDLFVVDVPRHLDHHLVTLLDRCAKIILVFEANISAVAACQRWLQVFAELGYESERVMLVVNRSGSKNQIVEQQLGTCFAGRHTWKIPNASSLTRDSSNHGIPVVLSHSGSKYAKSVAKLSVDLQQTLNRGDRV
jgi:Flp pilus assembly CpaE family ATPase